MVRAPAFCTGVREFKSRCHYSRRKLCILTNPANCIVIENALGRELWTPSSAHQCTPVVLNYSCCGVAVVVLGLNWPVCFPPLSQVRRKSVSPGREVPRSTNLLAGAESLILWDTHSIYDGGHSNKQTSEFFFLDWINEY